MYIINSEEKQMSEENNEFDFDLSDIANDIASMKQAPPAADIKLDTEHKIREGSGIDTHPDANMFPLMSEEDKDGFALLVEDIITTGIVNEPIKIDKNGVLLDGRNRVAAIYTAEQRGHQPVFTVEVVAPSNVREWIMSTNLHRRHLDTAQRAMIAAAMANSCRANKGESGVMTQKETAAVMNVSPASVAKAKEIRREAKPAVIKAVTDGKISLTKALEQTKQENEAAAPEVPVVPKPAPIPTTAPVKAKAAPVAKKDPPKVLNDIDLADVKAKLARASGPQLAGLAGYIKGLISVGNS